MIKTIWDLVNSTGNVFDEADKTPYLTPGQNNHFQLACDSKRTARQREHALNHCFAMASHSCQRDQYPLSCDWVVAAAALAENGATFLSRLFDLWTSLIRNQPSTWPELLRQPPEQFNKRLLALTIVRIYVASRVDFAREHNASFIDFARPACLDVFERLKILEKQQPVEQIRLLKTLDKLVPELLHPLEEAASATDLRIVMRRVHVISRALNDSLIKALMSPHLPPSFTKTTVPALFSALEPLIGSHDSRFIEHVEFARTELSNATKRLKESLSFYSAAYLLPLLENLSHLVELTFQNSDAIKPARLTIEAYPRKYPFHANNSPARLRFVVDNHGPGPARDIEMHFTLFDDLNPDETTIWISELGVGRQAVDLDVVVGDVRDSVAFHVRTVWHNVDSTEAVSEIEGVLECQNPDVDWEKLIRGDPYSIRAIDLDSERPFVGRETDVQQLLRSLAGKTMGAYGPSPVSDERVRAWVSQFDSNKDQRVMFQLLKSLRFYSEATVREKLRSAMTYIRKETIEKKRDGERHRRDILVSYLDGVAKSGTQYARMFCQENKILAGNAVDWEALEERIKAKRDEIQAVVVIDDIIGTGTTATESLTAVNERIGNLLRESTHLSRTIGCQHCNRSRGNQRQEVRGFVDGNVRQSVEISIFGPDR